jgi:hypothetical protein
VSGFNHVASAIFDVVLAPFGHRQAWFDLLLWPLLAGIVALLVYKRVSNQAGIARAKNGITVHLLEVMLYRDDLVGVLVSTAKAMGQNMLYLAHNLLPMLVMFVPMMAILVQLVSHYALDPVPAGSVQLLSARIDPAAHVKATDVRLELPAGVTLDAPPVRTPNGEIVWRLRAETAGDYVLRIHVGDEVIEQGLAVGGGPRKVPVMRTKSWEALLYPGEAPLPRTSSLYSADLHYPDRVLRFFPSGEGGILAWFFIASLAAGFALKNRFGVTFCCRTS